MLQCEIHGANDLRLTQGVSSKVEPQEVRVAAKSVGICGSDLHYFHRGRVGDFVIREALIPGHEVSGQVLEIGKDVTAIKVGDHVAVNPSRVCGHCVFCRSGDINHCENVHFFGSASKFPHMQGAMREEVVVDQFQCVKTPDGLAYELAAFAEPLSVALHAVGQAGSLLGKKVLVVGAGPIGALVVVAVKLAGASKVTVVDIVDHTLEVCRQVGADETINVRTEASGLDSLTHNKGQIDVCFEVSGSYAGLTTCINVTRPKGKILQVGTLTGDSSSCPFNQIMVKSISFIGTFRFNDEFAWAVDYLSRGVVDVAPILSAVIPANSVKEAFALASDRNKALKVMVSF